jgi:hypothetical protein
VLSLAAVLEPGGTYYMMCFSDAQPGIWGPRRVRREEIEQAFADGWEIVSLTPDAFAINPVGDATEALAWLAVIRRR